MHEKHKHTNTQKKKKNVTKHNYMQNAKEHALK